ncbi:hypothetical protein NQZ68_007188 [Dissostichus eleginoides]|nr:hypothetical protein NQZ68_007188 [Dissostichus eleginoides]
MWKQTTTTFPDATIYIPIINFSDRLNPKQQTLRTAINNTIALKYNFIPEINPLLFRLEVLEKGLTFIPTPKPPTRPELRADLHAFHRRIKLKDHFLGSQGREPVPFTGPSTWEPYTDTLTPEITQLISRPAFTSTCLHKMYSCQFSYLA